MKIIVTEQPKLSKLVWKRGYWILDKDFEAVFITDEATYTLRLRAGWITDLRSGSSWVDWIVPKRGSKEYNAIIMLHDCAYSGWLEKNDADSLLRRGLVVGGLSELRAEIAYSAVHIAGGSGYYKLDQRMPTPYTHNRSCEFLTKDITCLQIP